MSTKLLILSFILLSLLTIIINAQTTTTLNNVQQMDMQELQKTKRLIQEQLAAYDDPWRWYQIVGIGIAILIGYKCVKCCFPLCLSCTILCCAGLYIYIDSRFINKNRYNQNPNQNQQKEQSKLLTNKSDEEKQYQQNQNNKNEENQHKESGKSLFDECFDQIVNDLERQYKQKQAQQQKQNEYRQENQKNKQNQNEQQNKNEQQSGNANQTEQG